MEGYNKFIVIMQYFFEVLTNVGFVTKDQITQIPTVIFGIDLRNSI
jgi:hypothetical protein